jgi:hypothetical protein
MRFGLAAATPVEYHPVLSRAAITDGPLFEKDNADVLLTTLRRTRDGKGFFVHLTNPTATLQSVRLKLPIPWDKAFHSNALEECLTPVAVSETPVLECSLEPRSHVLLRLE